MDNLNKIYNGLIVFERAIQIADRQIYGIIFDKETEIMNTEQGHTLEDYVAYMTGAEFFMKNGGTISKDGDMWYYPDGRYQIECNYPLRRLLMMLMKGLVKIRTLEFEEPIVWNEGEIDNEKNPCLITSPDLIERYTKTEAEK